jgi:hypothetical protein
MFFQFGKGDKKTLDIHGKNLGGRGAQKKIKSQPILIKVINKHTV